MHLSECSILCTWQTAVICPYSLNRLLLLMGCALRSLCGTNWFCTKKNMFSRKHASSVLLVAAETWVRARTSQCGICGVQNRSGPSSSPTLSVFPLSVSFHQRPTLFASIYFKQKVKKTRPGKLTAKKWLFRDNWTENTGLFISPSGISELDCATTKTDTAERSISIGRESLQVFLY